LADHPLITPAVGARLTLRVVAFEPVAGYDGAIEPNSGRPEVRPPDKLRSVIGPLILVIAVFVCVLVTDQLGISRRRPVLVCFVWLFTPLVLLLLDMALGNRCPACSRWALRRLARHPRYYCCSACRERFKRFGFGPWLDASGPDDAARYRKPTDAGIWKGFAVPEQLDRSTSGALLQNKRAMDLPREARRRQYQPSAERPLEEARRKVRKFLKHLKEIEEL
jgi:hypothetical protein